jgi:hypothetical protein
MPFPTDLLEGPSDVIPTIWRRVSSSKFCTVGPYP